MKVLSGQVGGLCLSEIADSERWFKMKMFVQKVCIYRNIYTRCMILIFHTQFCEVPQVGKVLTRYY